MKNLLKIILFLALVMVIGFVVKAQLEKTNVAPGPLTLYGNVDIRQVALGFRASGRIDSMVFEEGDSVISGQLLATLDKGPQEDSRALFKAQAGVAEASLAKLEAGSRPAEIAQAKAVVEERQTAVTNTQLALDRQRELTTTGAASKQAVDDAQAQHDASAARLASAKEALALAEEGQWTAAFLWCGVASHTGCILGARYSGVFPYALTATRNHASYYPSCFHGSLSVDIIVTLVIRY